MIKFNDCKIMCFRQTVFDRAIVFDLSTSDFKYVYRFRFRCCPSLATVLLNIFCRDIFVDIECKQLLFIRITGQIFSNNAV